MNDPTSNSGPPATPSAPRLQFSLGELMLAVCMTMVGMMAGGRLLLLESEALGAFLTIPATWAGAFWGFRQNSNSRSESLGVFLSILVAWLMLLGFRIAAENSDVLFIIGCYCVFPVLVGIVAWEIYRRSDYDTDGVLEYAQSIGGNFSLLERTAGSGDLAIVDRTFAMAEGTPLTAAPKAGYVFKVLTAQGPHATGGAMSYLDEKGNQTRGYALLAVPALYGGTGRDSFIISHHGLIYQADVGGKDMDPITEFDPDPKVWELAE